MARATPAPQQTALRAVAAPDFKNAERLPASAVIGTASRAVRAADEAGQQTMSSRQIAELTGSTHDNVLKTVRGLIKRGVVSGNETPYVHPQNGQTYSEVHLNYRNTMVVVSGYSVELRARIIDKWQELEHAAETSRRPTGRRPSTKAVTSTFEWGRTLLEGLGLRDNQAVLGANALTTRLTGVDILDTMGVRHLTAPQPEILLNATEIGERLGDRSARSVNTLLSAHGFQTGGPGAYEPTPKGVEAGGVMVDVARPNGTGNSRQLRWASGVVATLGALLEQGQ